MADEPILLTDDPAPHVRRITLNRPAKRNALSNALRGEMVFVQAPDVLLNGDWQSYRQGRNSTFGDR